jgi:mannose-6-phosphate isomerase-like protein (cupin superfamily)
VSVERWMVVAAVLALAGCGSAPPPNPRLMFRYDKNLEVSDLNSLIQRAGPGPVAALDLGHTAWVSHHLAVIRDAEVAHYHRFHDLTVVILRGEGVMDIEGRKYEMKRGDVLVVNRGVRHFFRNTGDDLCAAFVTFSPPFDGRDTVTAEDVRGAEPPESQAPAKEGAPAAKPGPGASP